MTRTGTLSFEMMSCGGTCRVTIRRSMRTIRSITGISRKRPGPDAPPLSRPSRKITPRSYSRSTFTDDESTSTSNTSRTTTTPMTTLI